MPRTTDAWADEVARALVSDLTDRGLDLQVRQGRLRVAPQHLLTPDDDRLIRQHRDAMIVIVLVCDNRTLDRLLAMRAGWLGRAITTTVGHCHVCSDRLPPDREHGRCGWCALASRLYAGAPLPPDLVLLFPADVRGPVSIPATPDGALPFDYQVPA